MTVPKDYPKDYPKDFTPEYNPLTNDDAYCVLWKLGGTIHNTFINAPNEKSAKGIFLADYVKPLGLSYKDIVMGVFKRLPDEPNCETQGEYIYE